MGYIGDIKVDCTLTFKGSVRATLYEMMTIEEIIHDIMHVGDYEIEVVSGGMDVEEVEEIED